jgi:hypothetical protein
VGTLCWGVGGWGVGGWDVGAAVGAAVRCEDSTYIEVFEVSGAKVPVLFCGVVSCCGVALFCENTSLLMMLRPFECDGVVYAICGWVVYRWFKYTFSVVKRTWTGRKEFWNSWQLLLKIFWAFTESGNTLMPLLRAAEARAVEDKAVERPALPPVHCRLFPFWRVRGRAVLISLFLFHRRRGWGASRPKPGDAPPVRRDNAT